MTMNSAAPEQDRLHNSSSRRIEDTRRPRRIFCRDKPSLDERFSELGSASAKAVLIILLEPSTRSSKASDSEHQRHELRSQAARHVNRPPVGRELRHPVECAAVGKRYLEAVARLRRDLEAQAAVVVRVLEPGARD